MSDPRLGRIYKPDERDWSPQQLHAHLRKVTPPEPDLNATLGESIDGSAWFKDWNAYRLLWAWIKRHRHPKPEPGPTPNPAPADPPAWNDPVVLDQGDYGTCVGNGWAGWMASDPVEDPNVNETLARAIYYAATIIDGDPDDPDAPGGGQQGASVRAGAQAVQNRGRLLAYAFAKSLSDVNEWLGQHGPVVFGTDWTSDMFNPDHNGLVHATGAVEGGHCYLCVDYIAAEGNYLFVNSWGTGWGVQGKFKMSSADVQKLLDQQGEAVLAAELPLS